MDTKSQATKPKSAIKPLKYFIDLLSKSNINIKNHDNIIQCIKKSTGPWFLPDLQAKWVQSVDKLIKHDWEHFMRSLDAEGSLTWIESSILQQIMTTMVTKFQSAGPSSGSTLAAKPKDTSLEIGDNANKKKKTKDNAAWMKKFKKFESLHSVVFILYSETTTLLCLICRFEHEIKRIIPVEITTSKRLELASFINAVRGTKSNGAISPSNFKDQYIKYLQENNIKIENVIQRKIKGGACVECGGINLNNAAIAISFFSKSAENYRLVPYFVCHHFRTKHPKIYSTIKYVILFHAYSQ